MSTKYTSQIDTQTKINVISRHTAHTVLYTIYKVNLFKVNTYFTENTNICRFFFRMEHYI